MRSWITLVRQFLDTNAIGRPCPTCPCKRGAMLRYIKCDDSTDGLKLHFEKCNICGFEIYKSRVNERHGLHYLYVKEGRT